MEKREDDPDESYGDYSAAYETASGRLKKSCGSFEEFRENRLDVRYSKVRVVAVRRVDEVTDSAGTTSRRTVTQDDGDEKCTYDHYRYQVRVDPGRWTLDDRKPLADSSTSG